MARNRINREASVPAPVGGINARDPIASQKPEDAVHLVNWWPTAFDVQVRKGYTRHTTGTTNPARRLMAYRTSAGTDKIFYTLGGSIYDGTTAGAHGSAVASLAGSEFYYVNISTSGGQYLFVTNETDGPRHYNGTTWATPSITGLTASTLVYVTMHKDRLWFAVEDSLQIAYLGSKAVAGTAAAYDLRSLCRQGGFVKALTTWTIDAGEGMDDHLVIITSEGECLVYKGTDPSSADTWALVGIWQLSRPVSRLCFAKFGGDVVYFGQDGAVLLSKALVSSRVNTSNALTDRIRPLIASDWERYGLNVGWSVHMYPQQSMLILNVPESVSKSHQWVMNTITGAWTRFEGIDAFDFVETEAGLYFSQTGQVSKFWDGYSDNPEGSTDRVIAADGLQSFQTFGSRTANKRFVLVRPNLLSEGAPGLWYQVNTDYNPSGPAYTPSYSATTNESTWGTAVWGNFTWSGGRYQLTDWQHGGAIGRSAALWLRCVAKDIETRWSATDYIFEPGGAI